MSKYKCEPCEYTTDRSTDLIRHKKSKKHLKQVEDIANTTAKAKNKLKKAQEKAPKKIKLESEKSEVEESSEESEEPDKLTCNFCKAVFKHYQSKVRHEKVSCKQQNDIDSGGVVKLLIEQNKNLMEQYNNVVEQNKNYMEQNKNLTNAVVLNAHATNKSMSTTSYIVKHFDKAPPIKKLKSKEAMKLLEYDIPENYTLGDVIIAKHSSKKLSKYLGDIIVETYKTENPADQSFWNSDSVRLSFIVREALTTGGTEWITDKSGIKLIKLIIDPMLENAKDTLKNYMNEKSKESKKSNNEYNDIEIMENMTFASDIISSINKKDLHKDVLKYISPQFNLDVNRLKLLDI